MIRRQWNLSILLLALGALLVACGSAAQSALPPSTDPPPSATAAPTQVPTITATATPEPEVAPTSTQEAAASESEETVSTTADEDSESGILTTDDRSELFREITQDWNTNWNRHTVRYEDIVPVLFRDAIRSLDQPSFETVEQASEWLPEDDPIIAFELDGDARAYPLRILSGHEIVNDQFGDEYVAVTYCPLCNSAVVFDRRFGGEILEFGTSGMLLNSDLIMYDRTTETMWQQFTGEGIVGDLAGERLVFLPSSIISFREFGEAFPEGLVLSQDTGFRFNYSLRSYEGYDLIDSSPFLFRGTPDPRLPAMERVVSITLDDLDIAYPLSVLQEVGTINDTRAGQDLVVFHSNGTKSAFFNPITSEWTDVGATGVFDPNLDGRKLTFVRDGEQIKDEQTETVWNILGQAVEGQLAGEALAPILHADHFWFSWAAFKPDTLIYDDAAN